MESTTWIGRQLQRRVLRVLTGGQIVGAAALGGGRHGRGVRRSGHPRRRHAVGGHRHGDGDHRHRGDGPTLVASDVAPRPAAGLAARLRTRRRGRRDRGHRRRAQAARRVRRRIVPLRQRAGIQPARPLRRHRPRRSGPPRPGDEPCRLRLDVRGRVRTAAHRPSPARRRGVVRLRPLHRTVAVQCRVLRRGDGQHGGAVASRPARRGRRRGDGCGSGEPADPSRRARDRRGTSRPDWRSARWRCRRRRWSP